MLGETNFNVALLQIVVRQVQQDGIGVEATAVRIVRVLGRHKGTQSLQVVVVGCCHSV